MSGVPASSHGGGGAPAAVLASTPRTLTNAEIRALPSTPIELVPAPGAGKMILPLRAFLVTNFAVAYTGINVATNYPSIITALTNPGGGTRFSGLSSLIDEPDTPQSTLTAFLTYTFGKSIWTMLPELQVFATATDGAEIASAIDAGSPLPTTLVLRSGNSGDFTGGDPANTLTVVVHYTLLDV